jgi:hypothetical protein
MGIMNLIEQASLLLSTTEAKLRQHVADAATAGDYASVVQLAAWARTVSQLLIDQPIERSSTHRPGARASRPEGATPQIRSRHAERRPSVQSYPKFFRDEDRLVRVAWSKREKKEYEHKAPLTVLSALSAAIAESASDGQVFSMNHLLPIHEADGTDIPSYQAYVGLALLKHAGLIDQHGRQGYSLPRPNEFKNAVDAVWRSLPTQ